MNIKRLCCYPILVSVLSSPAIANNYHGDYLTISGFVGGRASSDQLKDDDTEAVAKFDSASSQAIALGWRYERNSEGELLFSHSKPKLNMSDDSINDVSVDVQYLHFGGRVLFKNKSPFSTSLGIGIGATHFNPAEGYDSEFALSGNITGGLRYQLNQNFALRGDLRIYGTLLNSSSSLFCKGDGTCILSIDGDVYVQTELMAGLEYKF